MEELIRIAVVCVALSLLALLVGQGSRSMAALLTLALGLFVALRALALSASLWQRVSHLAASSSLDGALLAPLARVLTVSLCARMAAELCRDLGSRAAACGVETLGVLTSLICMLPLLEEVLKLVERL